MDKRELIRIYEKARTQTKGEALRVVDLLSGVRGDPLNRKKNSVMNPEPPPSSQTDPGMTDKAEPG
jgi:hypothetical protein